MQYTQSENTSNIQEVHTTHKDKEEPHKEPTTHDEQVVEEMNPMNIRHAPETEFENEMSDTTNHIGTVDKNL